MLLVSFAFPLFILNFIFFISLLNVLISKSFSFSVFLSQCNNLLLLAVTKRNSNVALILFFLYRLTTVRTELNRNVFSLIYVNFILLNLTSLFLILSLFHLIISPATFSVTISSTIQTGTGTSTGMEHNAGIQRLFR